MVDKFTVECYECKSINEIYWVEDLVEYYISNGGDFGLPFKCWNCGSCFLKMKFYPHLIPIPK